MPHLPSIIKIENLSVNSHDLGDLENITISINRKGIVSIVCSKEEGQLLALSLQGKISRLHGTIFVDESYIPSSPFLIFKKLKKMIKRNIKFIDLDTRSVLSPNLKVKDSLFKLMKEEDYFNRIKEKSKARLHKKILLEIAKHVKESEKKDYLLKNINIAESKVYAKRNLLHLKQLLLFNRMLKIENLWTIFNFYKKFWKIKHGLYIASIENQISEYISNSNTTYSKNVKNSFIKYKNEKKRVKANIRKIKNEIWHERFVYLNFYIIFKKIRRILKEIERVEETHQYKKDRQFKWFSPHTIDFANESMFNIWKKRLKNFFAWLQQLQDKWESKKIWSVYKSVLCINKQVSEYIVHNVNEYLLSFTKRKRLLMQKTRIKELFEIFNLPFTLLDVKAKELTKGEQFDLSILIGLIIKPKVIIVVDCENMDATIRGQKIERVKKLAQEYDGLILFLTSDIEIGLNICDYCYILNYTIVEQGKPNEILSLPIHQHTRNLLTNVLPYELTNLNWHLTSKEKRVFNLFAFPPYCLTATHIVYENEFIISYWLKQKNQYEMDALRRYSIQKPQILDL